MNIPDRDLKQKIIDQLAEFPVYYPNRSKTQHVIRCQACGDSDNLSHAHLSIHIDVDDDRPMVYRCFRCNDSGIVSLDKLYDWGISLSEDDKSSFSIYTKKSKRKYNGLFNDNFEDYFIPEETQMVLNQAKINYLNARLGSSFTLSECRELKIVTNVQNLLAQNQIRYNVEPKIIQMLQMNFIGFLSLNNNRIMCRNINPLSTDKDFRWYNLILNEKNLNPYTFYSIPNSLNLYYTHDINIHVAEGIFDILSIYTNLKQRSKENNFYYASCGAAAANVMGFLIDRGINTGINLHLYADKDKSDDFHMKYLRYESNLYQWCDKIIIHRNRYTGEKDYGVPMEKIKDSYRTIYRK